MSLRYGLLCFAAVAALTADSVAAAGRATGASAPKAPCIHELTYEPFAGLILVAVSINGSPPMDFVLDSGATGSSITDPFLAAALGLDVRDAGLARGMGSGATRVLITENAAILADGFEILRTPLVVHDIGVRLSEMAGRDLHGFLGADLFQRWVVEIDPATHRLLLYEPDTYAEPRWGEKLQLEIVDGRLIVEAEVVLETGGKEVDVRLVLDTGSNRYLTLITGSKRRLKPPSTRSVGASVGVVGETLVPTAPLARLTVGSMIITDLETAWMEPYQIPAVRNIPNLNGIVGNALLSRFRTVFDPSHGQLILGHAFGNPDTMNEMPN